MRLALAASLESRDGTLTRDAKVMNGLVEVRGDTAVLRKRPGLTDEGLVLAGLAQGLTYWNRSIITIQNDYINIGSNTPTWNSADKGAGIALSGGNLVTAITTTTQDSVRCGIGKTSGKWYWEVTVTTLGGVNAAIGVANGSESMSDANSLGVTTNSTAAVRSNGNIIFNNGVLNNSLPFVTGDVIGLALDIDNRTLRFYQNNTLIYTATTAGLPTGTLYPAVGGNGNAGATTLTTNFGATSFAYLPPYGYSGFNGQTTWSASSSTALSPSSPLQPFSMQDNGSNAPTPRLMVKNATQAWTVNNAGTVTRVTDVDYPGQYTVTLTSLTRSSSTATAQCASDANFQVGQQVTIAGAGQSEYNGVKTLLTVTPSVTTDYPSVDVATITRSGTTATVTTAEAHGLENGQSVVIAGAEQPEYNGTFTITWISATSFSYTCPVTASAITTPATGTLVAGLRGAGANVAASGAGTITVTLPSHGLETGALITLGYFIPSPPTPNYVSGAITVTGTDTFTLAGTVAAGAFSMFIYQTLPSISSITGSGTTATVTFSGSHHITRWNNVDVYGAAQAYYNVQNAIATVTGATTITYTMPDAGVATPASPATGTITAQRASSASGFSFTFAVTGTPVTPATGTITATVSRNTVPGIVYVDGYFGVMDDYGVIYTSPEDDPSTWDPLDYTIAQAEPGAGRAIAKSLHLVAAMKEWSTEFFYDAANEVGSPLSPVPNGFTQVGCAAGWSVADVGGTILWIAQGKKQTGRSVYSMVAEAQQKVSSEDVDRILNADSLADVIAYGVTIDGHPCYVLTLRQSAVTLCYDLKSGAWTQWTSLTAGTAASITSITRSGTTCTVTFAAAHGLSDGDPLLIAGASQSDYNGIQQVQYVSTTVVTFETTATPVTPATGTITGTPYTESYFKFPRYASCNGQDMVLHESDGHLYLVASTVYRDAGLPINVFARTKRLDGGSQRRKKMARIGVVADSVADTAMLRWSDDDSATFSSYQPVTLSDKEPNIRRCGGFQRRSIEYRHIGNTAPTIEGFELEVSQ